MQHDEQVRLLKELRRQLDAGVNIDSGHMLKNPASSYTSAKLAAKEWEVFFRTHPQIVGLSGDLPEPGSFITLDDFGIPVLATRDRDGVFHAFLNSCRHRGPMIETSRRGRKKAFSCPFHGWTYSAEGALVAIPESDDFGPIDKTCHGLVELPAKEAFGFLIVHPQVGEEIDETSLFGGLQEEFGSWDWARLIHGGETAYDMALNWKLAIDTFGETYHFKRLHGQTLGQVFYGDVLCYDEYQNNHRMILCMKAIDELHNVPEERWRITDGAFPVYYLFPNVQVNVGSEGVTLVRVYPYPDNPGRSISQITFYFTPEALIGEDARSVEERARVFGEIIRDEDYAICETTQKALSSGLQEYVIFGRNEPPLHHYHNTYRKMLGMAPLDEFACPG